MLASNTQLLSRAARLIVPRSVASRKLSTFTPSYPPLPSLAAAGAARPAFFHSSFHPIAASASAASSNNAQRSTRGASLALALLFGFSASVISLSNTDTLKLDAAPAAQDKSLTSIATDASKQLVVDPDTSLGFPLYLPTPVSFKSSSAQDQSKLRLVGLGVRTVSFLRVRVYVAALYIDENKLQERLTRASNDKTLEQNVKELLDDGTAAVIRIVPVRNTDFNHLRDGFIRALQNRLKKAIKDARVQTDSPLESAFQLAIQQIKDSFPRGSVPKGSPLDLVILPTAVNSKPVPASLNFEYDGQAFGQVTPNKDEIQQSSANAVDPAFTVARELALAYFADVGEISTPFKNSVQQGLQP
ncbi:chalcone isomerase [Moesziomyces antarcticus]|uniref:Chalcone isomerase n=2 Tax=Pseudozyma antarctica TaxID=84753 RepID=A0A081CGS1_PSEA2|nr:chalcone isomerase [Moesziomyces antarcticus]GAK65867.1 chalcone isomerase [Moesziomyces antarcticus]SPO45496.1 uncharacterized protein PSANT_03182 [Moesziomyces antarcticus]